MRVGIDVDGVLANFVGRALDWAFRFGVTPEPKYEAQVSAWNFEGALTPEQYRQLDRLIKTGAERFVLGMQQYSGALRFVERIVEAGHEVAYVTTPFGGAYGWAEARCEWLRQHMPPAPVISTKGKGAKAWADCDVLIDDGPHNVDVDGSVHRESGQLRPAWAGKGYLLTRPWNASHRARHCTRVNDYEQLLRLLDVP